MDYRPYIALDLETTGLGDTEQILQVAMIFDDLKCPIEALKPVSFLVNNINEPYNGFIDPEAISMNAWIFHAIVKGNKSGHLILDTASARSAFHSYILDAYNKFGGYAITFAGKNIGGFDIPLLRYNKFITPLNYGMISHRIIDIGALYFQDFGYVPTQNEINKLVGRQVSSHDAADDAMDVICAIRHKLKLGK